MARSQDYPKRFAASDNNRSPPPFEQVVHGFVDEFIAITDARNGLTGPVRYGKTFTRVHDPPVWRERSDQMLTSEPNIGVIYHNVT